MKIQHLSFIAMPGKSGRPKWWAKPTSNFFSNRTRECFRELHLAWGIKEDAFLKRTSLSTSHSPLTSTYSSTNPAFNSKLKTSKSCDKKNFSLIPSYLGL